MNHLKEVAALPLVVIGRFAINQVRRWYRALPDLEDPVVDGFAYEYDGKTRVKKLKAKTDALNGNADHSGATGNGTVNNDKNTVTAGNREKQSEDVSQTKEMIKGVFQVVTA